MAEDSGQDKSEQPTAKRLADARKKGQVPRSKELDTFVSLIVSAVMLLFLGKSMALSLADIMVEHFSLSRSEIFDSKALTEHFSQAIFDAVSLVAVFGLTMMVAALITPMMMGGWNFSSEAIQPKFSKFNPLKGLKRMFGLQGAVELLKAIAKVSIVFLMAWLLFDVYWHDFMQMNRLPVEQAIYQTGDIITRGFLLLSAALLLVVLIDVPYQLWNHTKQLMMTKQEIKDESKESEGNPEIKGRIRRAQMEISQRRMMDEVPKADVIVTNPTHFAVALRYDQNGEGAPILVAKGTDLIAAQIRNLAIGADVPLVAAPSLARALYYSTELNQEIPHGLFLAVAQVLAYVFQLQAATENGWEKPVPPDKIDVPDEFRQR
ncbi:flagellar biosynthesis protein FlhB [methane-oxidizing endosymbiont of Gigantopelta aegis]|uniref:flagellar biosynthesis protein FlhB n=1 Tax=methane-oxidizing endosymbiont of Gigantopelta aegis TaxID=2794938 RepID=UPI0018DDE1A3|nr:flagellar biosynthesis protein FlhB [methane-oxidizing endosymbiont of Gigantopelta aegis]